jgi:hypothetical protein
VSDFQSDDGDPSASDDAALSATDDGDGFLYGDLHFQAAEKRNPDKWASGLSTVRQRHGKDETTLKHVLGRHLLAARILGETVNPQNLIHWSGLNETAVYRWVRANVPGCLRQ